MTDRQRAALIAIRDAGPAGLDARELAVALVTSREGAGMTAASLVRHRLVARTKVAGRVRWVATP